MNKETIRRSIRLQKQAMTTEEILCRSQRLLHMLTATDAYQQAQTLYGYLSCNQEVRTKPILEQAVREGKRVAVPKIFHGEMKFLYLDDLNAVAPGSFGIPEPIADGPEADDPNALVLLPGLAFDTDGRRIGYGGGYYDRFLSREPGHPTIALCYRFQLFEHLETDDHDIPADQVIWA